MVHNDGLEFAVSCQFSPQQEGEAVLECFEAQGRLLLPCDVLVFKDFLTLQARFIHIYPFTPSLFFGQVQKFFFRKVIASLVFMLERYIRRPFFLEKTLNLFSYMSEKTGKSSHK